MSRIPDAVLGAALGALAGGSFGVILGCLLAPAVDPHDKLAHEWYTLAVYAYVLWSAIGGAVLGCVLAAASDRRMSIHGASGLVVGGVVGFIFWHIGPVPPHHAYTGMTIIGFTFSGGILGVVGAAVTPASSVGPNDARR
jgi:hypothetical protein